jgi:phasin
MQRTPFDIPVQMREVADRSVTEAKKAFDQFVDATQKAVASAERSASSAREGAAEANRQAMAFVEENVAASFDFAHRVVQARTIEEITALQQEFLQRQMAASAVQGKALGEMVGKAARDAMPKPKA